MTGSGHQPPNFLFRRVPLASWICLCMVLAQLFALGCCSTGTLHATDRRPRAALVSFAHENDLNAILGSVSQLEDRFNSRYQYDWIFFSTAPLSDEFKRLTSNATTAVCLYEIISGENWNVPQRTRHLGVDAQDNSHGDDALVEGNSDVGSVTGNQPLSLVEKTYRWKSGPFAKEHRLRDYDWFWRIEPGAQFRYDIQFDIFRYMRDRGIACGFNKAILADAHLRPFTSQIKSFVDKHAHLLHEEADLSWLGEPDKDAFVSPVAHTYTETNGLSEYETQLVLGKTVAEGSHDRPSHPLADSQQEGDFDEDMDNETSPLAEMLASWLGSIYDTGLSPSTVMGSLAYFRSPGHQALLEHLDSAGDLYSEQVQSIPINSLSATMFLPRKSVWSLSKLEAQAGSYPTLPDPTADPELWLEDAEAVMVDSDMRTEMQFDRMALQQPGVMLPLMKEVLSRWDVMARDLGRQDGIPGLRSGNTVIDERNFAMLG